MRGDVQRIAELQRLRSSLYDQLVSGSGEMDANPVQLLRTDGTLLTVEIHRQVGRAQSEWMLVEVIRDPAGAK
jgi:hypothetical protein